MLSALRRANAALHITKPPASRTAPLHTTTPARETKKQLFQRMSIERHKTRQADRERWEKENAPHVALGVRPGEEHKWENCALARCVRREADAAATTHAPLGQEIVVPAELAHGVGPAEAKLLFEHLPVGTADMQLAVSRKLASRAGGRPAPISTSASALWAGKTAEASYGLFLKQAVRGARTLAQMLDYSNASAGGRAFADRIKIVQEFSCNPERPSSRSPEVQAAILTYRIRNVWSHLQRRKRDIGNRRNLRAMIHQRAKILRYLKREDRERYYTLLERIGVEPGAVEGELIV